MCLTFSCCEQFCQTHARVFSCHCPQTTNCNYDSVLAVFSSKFGIFLSLPLKKTAKMLLPPTKTWKTMKSDQYSCML